jgi:3-deoxy-D-manno-octulosonic-acid transferase
MRLLLILVYNVLVVPLLTSGFWIAAFFDPKARAGWEGRRDQFPKLAAALAGMRADRKRILFHCTSVGECEQALPIAQAIKDARPDIATFFSFFSPSGYAFLKQHPAVDHKLYLPLDSWGAMNRFLKLLAPDLVVISKFDVWPDLVWVAKKRGIPAVITSATLSSNSRRDKGLAGWLNAHVFDCLDAVLAITAEDAARFRTLGLSPDRVFVTGDTRFDQVRLRGERARAAGDVTLFKEQPALTIIGGSLWPADERHFLPAAIAVLKKHPEARLILVPHEPREAHLAALEKAIAAAGLGCERYSDFAARGGTAARVALIDTVGMLARLYKQTDIAYIGGSFGSGVHNVMEPAVFGQPVLFGPRHENSAEALELMSGGCAFAAGDSRGILDALTRLAEGAAERRAIGEKARDYIASRVGATAATLTILKGRYDFLSDPHPD